MNTSTKIKIFFSIIALAVGAIHALLVLFGALMYSMSHGPNGPREAQELWDLLTFPLSLVVDGNIITGWFYSILIAVLVYLGLTKVAQKWGKYTRS